MRMYIGEYFLRNSMIIEKCFSPLQKRVLIPVINVNYEFDYETK